MISVLRPQPINADRRAQVRKAICDALGLQLVEVSIATDADKRRENLRRLARSLSGARN